VAAHLTLVAALARNRAIGIDGRMPWHLPGELRHFKELTLGKPIVMGRKTHESIGRPLPGRRNIVVSRDPAYRAEGCEVADSLDEALALAGDGEVMLIGGGELYRLGLPRADRMVLTLVDLEPDADTWFPAWNEDDWEETARREHAADGKTPVAFTVVDLRRVRRATD
jgi:dihydrofolate reductase